MQGSHGDLRVHRIEALALVSCLAVLLTSGCSVRSQGATRPPGQDALEATQPTVKETPELQKWEYSLGAVAYDVDCATEAIAPYRENATVKDLLTDLSPNRYFLALLHMYQQMDTSLNEEDWYEISDGYVKCGQEAFQIYSNGMGEQGWEMVSYSRLEYTSSGSQYVSGLVVDYGYEVMWKRPWSAE